ncbi:hypothetical protein [Paenibacillus xylanexedens]|uniref:hypothetical protein n=1 Tax=Paenibacillus xylanexedens TaxID=528191 RepID=UPI001C92C211|nr:hypothetical protein [Paenibacillus xylanexedens]
MKEQGFVLADYQGVMLSYIAVVRKRMATNRLLNELSQRCAPLKSGCLNLDLFSSSA